MAETDFGLINPNEAKTPAAVYSEDGGTAGFVTPYKLATGIMRGTQGVGNRGPQIDSANNRITVGNIVLDGDTNTITTEDSDGSKVGMGLIPGTTNEFGQFGTDADGTLLIKIIRGTIYTYNGDTGANVVQISKLTNGAWGAAFAKNGEDLVDALGS